MKTILLRSCALLALAVSASAEIIGVDTFDYPNAAIADKSGGHTGSASDWDNIFGTPPVRASGRLVITSLNPLPL